LYIGSVAIGALAVGCSSCKRDPSPSSASNTRLTAGAAISVAPARAAYVTNNGSDSLSVIDRDGDAVVAVPIDVDPDAHEAPHHLAIDPERKAVFVALAFPRDPSVAPGPSKSSHGSHGGATDVGRIARLDLADLAVRQTSEVDPNPGDVIITHDRTRILVTHFDMKRAMDVAAKGAASPATMFAELVVLDARSPELRRVAARPICTAPHGVATTADDRWAFVACYGSDELAVVDLAHASEGLSTSRIPLGATPGVPGVPRYGPYSATLSPDDRHVVVADLEGQDLRVWGRAEERFLDDRTVTLAAKAFMPAFVDDHTLLVPLQAPDGLARVDIGSASALVTKRVAFSKQECGLPHAVKVAKDGRAYLVCEGDHRAPGAVLEIDPTTLATKRRWTVGVYPDGIAFGD
jgi:DNA-binding beta-propeller fold protein YncE